MTCPPAQQSNGGGEVHLEMYLCVQSDWVFFNLSAPSLEGSGMHRILKRQENDSPVDLRLTAQ